MLSRKANSFLNMLTSEKIALLKKATRASSKEQRKKYNDYLSKLKSSYNDIKLNTDFYLSKKKKK